MSEITSSSWIKKQKLAKDFEHIKVSPTDPVKDLILDASGYYVLVKIIWDYEQIAVAICNPEHEIVKVFQGSKGRDIWTAIFEYEQKHQVHWFESKAHAAYLGKELKKAEIALVLGNTSYFQE